MSMTGHHDTKLGFTADTATPAYMLPNSWLSSDSELELDMVFVLMLGKWEGLPEG
jgi:hypothetical protein